MQENLEIQRALDIAIINLLELWNCNLKTSYKNRKCIIKQKENNCKFVKHYPVHRNSAYTLHKICKLEDLLSLHFCTDVF